MSKKNFDLDMTATNTTTETADMTIDETTVETADETTTETHASKTTSVNVFDGMDVPDKATANISTPKTASSPPLVEGYLSNGYYVTAPNGKTKYPDPVLNDSAKIIGQDLAASGLKSSEFNKMLRELKKAKKRTLPIDAQTGAISALVPKALLLEQKKRAPHLFVEVLEANLAAVKDFNDFVACYNHLESVGVYLALSEIPKQAGI